MEDKTINVDVDDMAFITSTDALIKAYITNGRLHLKRISL